MRSIGSTDLGAGGYHAVMSRSGAGLEIEIKLKVDSVDAGLERLAQLPTELSEALLALGRQKTKEKSNLLLVRWTNASSRRFNFGQPAGRSVYEK